MNGKNMTLMITYLALVIAIICIRRVIRGRAVNAKYDERQLAVQGKAYKYAYFTMSMVLILEVLGDMMLGVKLIEANLLILIAVCVSVMVFAIACIMKDAYVAPKTDMRFAWMILVLVGGLNLVIGLIELIHGKIRIVNGTLEAFPVTLISGAVILGIVAAYGIRQHQIKREE